MPSHSTYHIDPDVQAAIEQTIAQITETGMPGTLTQSGVVKGIPFRVTMNGGVLCAVETWARIGNSNGLRHDIQDYTCVVCHEAIHDDPHTFHHADCPKRHEDNLACKSYLCFSLPDCGEDCHPDCCPTCHPEVGAAFDEAVTA